MNFKLINLLGVVIFSWLSFISDAQTLPIDAETQRITWVETVSQDSLTKDQLYDRAKRWLTIYYKNTTFDMDSKAIYTITKTGTFNIALTYDFKYKSQNTITYSISISFKDGRYRYKITDVRFYPVSSGAKAQLNLETAYSKMTTQNKNETNVQVNKEINTVIADLKAYMLKGEAPTTEEDW
ncbi:MAG: DUF4468 domain-containing protein [Cytophagaceae bacterium]|jgi:hypothetical protein|nr:DUF4468 domain-containing protein [Cytophagaceae bacterium]